MEILWHEGLSVGDATIDMQHRELLASINEIHLQVEEGGGEGAVDPVRAHIDEYSTKHFAYEEAFMERHGYPGLEEHRRIHREFLEKYAELAEGLDPNLDKRVYAERLTAFLGHWWITHIAVEDQKYHQYLAEHQQSHPSDEPGDYHTTIQK